MHALMCPKLFLLSQILATLLLLVLWMHHLCFLCISRARKEHHQNVSSRSFFLINSKHTLCLIGKRKKIFCIQWKMFNTRGLPLIFHRLKPRISSSQYVSLSLKLPYPDDNIVGPNAQTSGFLLARRNVAGCARNHLVKHENSPNNQRVLLTYIRSVSVVFVNNKNHGMHIKQETKITLLVQ